MEEVAIGQSAGSVIAALLPAGRPLRKGIRHAAGFDPLKAGGVADAGRIEMPGGDLHQAGLNGALLDLGEARAAVGAE